MGLGIPACAGDPRMRVELSCPLGHKCEEARDGAVHRCAWFVQLRGRNPNTGEEVDERGCAMAWMPVLLIETAGAARSTSAAVESFRNNMLELNNVPQPKRLT